MLSSRVWISSSNVLGSSFSLWGELSSVADLFALINSDGDIASLILHSFYCNECWCVFNDWTILGQVSTSRNLSHRLVDDDGIALLNVAKHNCGHYCCELHVLLKINF